MQERNGHHTASLLNTFIAPRYIRPLACIFVLAISLCCADSRMMRAIDGSPSGSEGFFDDNTLWIKSGAHPDAGIPEQAQRKASARENAVLAAQRRAIQYLTGYIVEGASGAFDMDYISRCMQARFNDTVRKGALIRETYGKNDSCGIIYVVRSPRLKREIFRCTAEDK